MLSLLILWALPSKAWRFVSIFWGKGVLFFAKYILGISYEVFGAEKLQTNQPFILACQHQSPWETIFLTVFLKNPAFVLKKELLELPVIGLFVKKWNMIPVDRKGENPQWLEDARSAFFNRRPIVIFPEGTRVNPYMGGKTKGKYRKGAYALATTLKAPVFPAALNSGKFWPAKQFLKIPGCIHFRIGNPLKWEEPLENSSLKNMENPRKKLLTKEELLKANAWLNQLKNAIAAEEKLL